MNKIAVTYLFRQTWSATGFFACGLGATLIILEVFLGDKLASVSNQERQSALKRSVADGAFGDADPFGGLTNGVKNFIIHEWG